MGVIIKTFLQATRHDPINLLHNPINLAAGANFLMASPIALGILIGPTTIEGGVMLSLKDAKNEIKQRLLRRLPEPGSFTTPMVNVNIHRRNASDSPRNCLYRPMVVYMALGKKAAMQGTKRILFGENELLVVGIDSPSTSNIVEATPSKPSMALSIALDMNLIGQLLQAMPWGVIEDDSPSSAMMLQPIDDEMLDAFLRLDTILDRPDELPVLGPMLIKEIHFRLLLGPNGARLRGLYSHGTQKCHVALALTWLRNNYKETFRVDDLAERVHMSPATFHRRFKEITTLSPIQFQKRLRLHEAQRLMLSEGLGIAEACDAVGYENLAQFTREYKRLFGEPPRRDVLRWQQVSLPTSLAAAK